jgi:hypothetical protein
MQDITDEIKSFIVSRSERVANEPGSLRRIEWEALELCVRITGLIIALVLLDTRVTESAVQEGLASIPDRVRSPRQVKREVCFPVDCVYR